MRTARCSAGTSRGAALSTSCCKTTTVLLVAEIGVLPIIGPASLGTTTLVQHVCDEPALRRRFSLIMLLDFHCMSLMAAGETALLLRFLFAVAGTASTSLVGTGEPLRLLEWKLHGAWAEPAGCPVCLGTPKN